MSGCGAKNEPSTLKVAAAADLTLAFQEIGKRFEAKTGTPVVFSFGSTGQLAEQIKNGAPFDVFAAANVQAIDELKKEHLILEGTEHVYAFGRIGIATKSDISVRTLNDLLKENVKKNRDCQSRSCPLRISGEAGVAKSRNLGTSKEQTSLWKKYC